MIVYASTLRKPIGKQTELKIKFDLNNTLQMFILN
jgi:hypothetical protein